MSNLDDLVAKLKKVQGKLAKRQTVPLRQEESDLMRKIQQIRQRQREDAAPADGPAPGTVSGGTGVNEEN